MDRFRLDDPDAAEKATTLLYSVAGWGCPSTEGKFAMAVLLDAIEQPRLPTRSEVEARFRRVAVGGWPAGRDSEFMVTPRSVASVLIDTGWATEDPEPEVDPLVTALGSLLLTTQDDDDVYGQARRLLASGRVQVTPQ